MKFIKTFYSGIKGNQEQICVYHLHIDITVRCTAKDFKNFSIAFINSTMKRSVTYKFNTNNVKYNKTTTYMKSNIVKASNQQFCLL